VEGKGVAAVSPNLDIATRLAADRTRLAYDRTMMAWVRTILGLLALLAVIFRK